MFFIRQISTRIIYHNIYTLLMWFNRERYWSDDYKNKSWMAGVKTLWRKQVFSLSVEGEREMFHRISREYIYKKPYFLDSILRFSSGNTIRVNVRIVFAATKVPRRRWAIIDNCAGVAAGGLFVRQANSGGGNFVREKLTVGVEPPSCDLAFLIMWKKFAVKL